MFPAYIFLKTTLLSQLIKEPFQNNKWREWVISHQSFTGGMQLNTFFSVHCLSYQSVQQYGSKSTQNWILTEQRLHIISLCKFKLQISNWIILKQSKKSDWVSSRKAMEINNRWNVIFIKTIIILKFLHFKRNIKLINILNFRTTKSHFLFSLYIG